MGTLKNIKVWRFGLYYFLVFGCFVAFANWLVPYFVNVYYLPLATAGALAAAFSFPSGAIRAFGGYLSDKFGGRAVMQGTLIISLTFSAFLIIPKMEILSPGIGIMAKQRGIVEQVSDSYIISGTKYNILKKSD